MQLAENKLAAEVERIKKMPVLEKHLYQRCQEKGFMYKIKEDGSVVLINRLDDSDPIIIDGKNPINLAIRYLGDD